MRQGQFQVGTTQRLLFSITVQEHFLCFCYFCLEVCWWNSLTEISWIKSRGLHWSLPAASFHQPGERSRMGAVVIQLRLQIADGQMGPRLAKQQGALCPHLYRDLSPPQHLGSSCWTQRADRVLSRRRAGPADQDSVFTSLMLGPSQSWWTVFTWCRTVLWPDLKEKWTMCLFICV